MKVDARYLSLCDTHSTKPDNHIAEAFRKRSSALSIEDETQLQIIVELLREQQTATFSHIRQIRVRVPKLSSIAVDGLSGLLRTQSHITHLNLSRVKLGDSGIANLLTSLSQANSSPLTHLNLSHTGLTSHGAKVISHLLSDPLGQLSELDLSNNSANGSGVHALEKSLSLRDSTFAPLVVDLEGNLVTVEVLNSVTHGLGALAALCGGFFMTKRALERELDTGIVVSLAVFIISLFAMMTSSCMYHSCFRTPNASRHMRKADHCSIFILIAGSYTPFVVSYALYPPTVTGPLTLVAVWGCAIAGVVRSVFSVGTSSERAIFALIMGWLGVFSARTVLERMQMWAMWLVVGGGLAYSLGIIFYLLGKKRPMFHVVWHVAVMAGGTFHYYALWQYVVNER